MIHPPPNTHASGISRLPGGKLKLVSLLSLVLGFSMVVSHPRHLSATQTPAVAAPIWEEPSASQQTSNQVQQLVAGSQRSVGGGCRREIPRAKGVLLLPSSEC